MMVEACRLGLSSFHCTDGSSAACCRNILSYSCHPWPPWRWASLTTNRLFVRRLRVLASGVSTAVYARKHDTQVSRDWMFRKACIDAVWPWERLQLSAEGHVFCQEIFDRHVLA